MSDIVTPDNEAKYRELFCIENNHTMICVEETVKQMSTVLACVCVKADAPIENVLNDIDIDVFKKHLEKILEQKQCNCKNAVKFDT